MRKAQGHMDRNGLGDDLPVELQELFENGTVWIVGGIVAIIIGFAIVLIVLGKRREKAALERRRQQELYRKQLIQQFQDEFGVIVPWEVSLELLPAPTSQPEYVLGFPAWTYACADGTRDRRYKRNPLVQFYSTLFYDRWKVTCDNPLSMNQLVIAMRQQGTAVPLCAEERNKRDYLQEEFRNRFEGASAFQLYTCFMDDSDGFEEWCAELVRHTGAQVTVTPSVNDGGYDLDIRHNGKRTLAECKCYNPNGNKVGRPLLQKLVGANATEHADRLLYMTTSSFSSPAIEYAQEQHMTLIDGKRLIKLDAKRRNKMRKHAVSQDAWMLTDEDLLELYPPDAVSY